MSEDTQQHRLSLTAATAIVVASMIGTGIFTTTGFMVSDLTPLTVLLGWLLGGVLALCGAFAYAELGAMMPRVGGEYVYLREAFHPSIGFLAGWVSLFVGFSAPIAAASIAFGTYLASAIPGVPVRTSAVLLIVLSSLLHARSVALGSMVQTGVTLLKITLIVAFVGLGLSMGDVDWSRLSGPPEGTAGATGSVLSPAFWVSLVYVSFSYTGWNAAAYVAGEIEDPRRNLPRALIAGTTIVTLLYMALNLVFLVAAPASELAGQPDVGFVAALHLFGPQAGRWMAALIAVGLAPAVSAMVFSGPRVYAAMAEDGYFFRGMARRTKGGAPFNGVALQGGLAVLFALFVPFDAMLRYVGFTLSLISALAVCGVAVLRRRQPNAERPYRTFGWPVTPLLFVSVSLWMALHLVREEPLACLAAGGGTLLSGLVAYALTSGRRAARS